MARSKRTSATFPQGTTINVDAKRVSEILTQKERGILASVVDRPRGRKESKKSGRKTASSKNRGA